MLNATRVSIRSDGGQVRVNILSHSGPYSVISSEIIFPKYYPWERTKQDVNASIKFYRRIHFLKAFVETKIN